MDSISTSTTKWSPDVPRYIKTDEKKLRQILLNLLGNAVKFTDEGSVILRVRLNWNGKAGIGKNPLTLWFEVEDTGPGILPEDREQLFEPFTQANGGLHKQEGIGLGLSICRQFVQQMGGQLNVDSIVEKGTTFEFNIRAQAAMASEMKPLETTRKVIGIKTDSSEMQDHRYRIVVVDDHKENRALLRMLLEQVGFSVKEAENGQQALELNESWRPHLLWMDMRMPGMNGCEATKKIRGQAKGQESLEQPVIIALTASVFEEDRTKVLAAGCDDFVRRPFQEVEIFEKMKQHLGVSYVYESGPESHLSSEESAGLSSESLRLEIACLPENIVKDLQTAAELSDMERMDQLVTDIMNTNKALAKEIKDLADTFQYDKILAILDKKAKTAKPDHGEN